MLAREGLIAIVQQPDDDSRLRLERVLESQAAPQSRGQIPSGDGSNDRAEFGWLES